MPRRFRVGENHLGRAVYATTAFEPGEVVGAVQGTVIDDPEYTTNYCIDLGGNFSLEPRPPFRFVNHCCSPNCELLLVDPPPGSRRKVPSVVLQTRKRIRPGEELSIDYSWPAHAAIPCQCGSRWCRGWVVAKTERHLVKGAVRRKKPAATRKSAAQK